MPRKYKNLLYDTLDSILYSLEPYEDPVTGLERIERASSSTNLLNRRRRVRLPPIDSTQSRQPVTAPDHALSGKYESLDYEIVESELYRAEENLKSFQVGSCFCTHLIPSVYLEYNIH